MRRACCNAMVRVAEKNIFIKPLSARGMRIFGATVKVLGYCALFSMLMSAVPSNGMRLIAVAVGAALSTVFLCFERNKYVKLGVLGAAVLYSALCAAIAFSEFYNGLFAFLDGVVRAANANLHYGWETFGSHISPLSDFLFASVVGVWLALFMTALVFKRAVIATAVFIAITVVWLCLGLYPAPFSVVLSVMSVVGLLIYERGFSLKAASCYLLGAIIVFCTAIPCFLYSGSALVSELRNSIIAAADSILYGTDSLPEGNLRYAAGMQSGSEARLEVALPINTPTLFLKGYVGADLTGAEWSVTDKNAYVDNRYQGLVDFISQAGIPTMQYHKYSALGGSAQSYGVTIKNVGANRKYVYMPYTVSSYSLGSQYYDLNVRAGVFSSRTNNIAVFAPDKSSERVVQAEWVLKAEGRTAAMKEYLRKEGEYRIFVNDMYKRVSPEISSLISARLSLGDINSAKISINTATQLLRTFFQDNYTYSDRTDGISSTFLTEFFGGKIKKANSAYFASAATYIYRVFGYAARYVEGYLVSADSSTAKTVSVTGKNAHAWTEVYFDGIGWLPIEVSPHYVDEEDLDNPVDPDNPVKPPEPPKPPEQPDVPPDDPVDPNDPEYLRKVEQERERLRTLRIETTVAKSVLSVLGILLGGATIMLVAIVRRLYIVGKRRKRLEATGEAYGRAAYSIAEKMCAAFGGFDADNLADYGIAVGDTARFIRLAERSVYGGYDLPFNEKRFVERYLELLSERLIHAKGKAKKLVYKYVKCIGV